jgi:hypothetical protein
MRRDCPSAATIASAAEALPLVAGKLRTQDWMPEWLETLVAKMTESLVCARRAKSKSE